MQYRETDFAFVSRLMEQHGIYYFFEHSKDKHMLVLADSKSSHKPVPGRDKIPFIALGGDDRRDREHIYHWATERRFRTGKVEFNDYDFKQPGKKLLVDAKASERYTQSDMEFYDYPGKYNERSDGEKYAKMHARGRAGARLSPPRDRRRREPVPRRPDQARTASEGLGEQAST